MKRRDLLAWLTGFVMTAKLSRSSNITSPSSSLADLDVRANVLDANDPDSIKALTTAVLSVPHAFEVPRELHNAIHPILSRAERNHLVSPVLGVHENSLSSAINDLFIKVNAPAFAMVTPHQLRVVRVLTLSTNPIFMGRNITTALAKPGDSINPYMSPLQAAHLSMVMADQKLINGDYQLEPSKWEIHHQEMEARQRQMILQRYLSESSAFGIRSPVTKEHRLVVEDNAIGKDLRASLETAFMNMSTISILELVHSSMSQLGVL